MDALTSAPEVWSKTVLLVTYDENDGFFDHIVPPFAPLPPQEGASTVDTSLEIYHGEKGPPGATAGSPVLMVWDSACPCSCCPPGAGADMCAPRWSTTPRSSAATR